MAYLPFKYTMDGCLLVEPGSLSSRHEAIDVFKEVDNLVLLGMARSLYLRQTANVASSLANEAKRGMLKLFGWMVPCETRSPSFPPRRIAAPYMVNYNHSDDMSRIAEAIASFAI